MPHLIIRKRINHRYKAGAFLTPSASVPSPNHQFKTVKLLGRARVEAAKRLLEKGKYTVEQVCMEVGYGDFGFFRNIFKRLTGLTPQEYKKKYSQMFNEAVVG